MILVPSGLENCEQKFLVRVRSALPRYNSPSNGVRKDACQLFCTFEIPEWFPGIFLDETAVHPRSEFDPLGPTLHPLSTCLSARMQRCSGAPLDVTFRQNTWNVKDLVPVQFANDDSSINPSDCGPRPSFIKQDRFKSWS